MSNNIKFDILKYRKQLQAAAEQGFISPAKYLINLRLSWCLMSDAEKAAELRDLELLRV